MVLSPKNQRDCPKKKSSEEIDLKLKIMITEKELKFILQEGEGYKIEFKENLSNISPDLVAFANSSGGRIFLGVKDNAKVKGIQITNKLKSQIQDMANNCDPKIKVVLEEVGNILTINVQESNDKPYKCSSGFYRRIGPNTQKLTRNEIMGFFKSEGKTKFDELIEPKFNYPKDFDKEKLSRFLELAAISKSMKVKNILVNLNVAEGQEEKLHLNNSGILFFAKSPQRFVPWSVFTVVLFKDYGGADVIDRKEITGSLFGIVDKVMDFVKLYTKVAYKFTGKPQREEIYEYPFEAIREAVINSVMHKDYFEHGHNNILKFFPDRIQIENIWVKPKNFILGRTIFRRNQLISDLFSRIHFGERIGSGMQRMKDICKQENAPYPKIEYTNTHFYIVFRQSKKYLKMAGQEKGNEEKTSSLNIRQKKAFDLIKQRGRLTMKEYINLCPEVNRRTLTRDLNYLMKSGLVIRRGKGKRDLYYVIAQL